MHSNKVTLITKPSSDRGNSVDLYKTWFLETEFSFRQ